MAEAGQIDNGVRRGIDEDGNPGHHQIGEGRACRARVKTGGIMYGRTYGLDLVRGNDSAQQAGVVDVGRGRGLQRAVGQDFAVGCRVDNAGGEQRG